MPKLTKPEAEYASAKPGGDRCGDCRWFELHRPNGCEIVEGHIAVNGWCRFHHDNAHRRGSRMMREQDRQRSEAARMREKTAEPDGAV